MSRYEQRPCPCGSGKMSHWLSDARGIPCCRVCPDCEQEKKKRYRPEIFTDSSYGTDEPVEPGDTYGAPYQDT